MTIDMSKYRERTKKREKIFNGKKKHGLCEN